MASPFPGHPSPHSLSEFQRTLVAPQPGGSHPRSHERIDLGWTGRVVPHRRFKHPHRVPLGHVGTSQPIPPHFNGCLLWQRQGAQFSSARLPKGRAVVNVNLLHIVLLRETQALKLKAVALLVSTRLKVPMYPDFTKRSETLHSTFRIQGGLGSQHGLS